jgi:hypothetical protein
MITNDQLSALLHDTVAFLRAAIAQDVTVPSHIVALRKVEDVLEAAYIHYELSSNVDKRRFFTAMGSATVKDAFYPEAALLISEAWYVVTSPNESTLDLSAFVCPSQNPARRECFMIAIMSMDGRTGGEMLPFERINGRVVVIEDDVEEFPVTDSASQSKNLESALLEYFLAGAREAE